MPFVSTQQRKWANTKAGTKALGGKKAVAEWEKQQVIENYLNMPQRKKVNSNIKLLFSY